MIEDFSHQQQFLGEWNWRSTLDSMQIFHLLEEFPPFTTAKMEIIKHIQQLWKSKFTFINLITNLLTYFCHWYLKKAPYPPTEKKQNLHVRILTPFSVEATNQPHENPWEIRTLDSTKGVRCIPSSLSVSGSIFKCLGLGAETSSTSSPFLSWSSLR